MKIRITLTIRPIPPKVAISPMSLTTASLVAMSIGGSLATGGAPVSWPAADELCAGVVAFGQPPADRIGEQAQGEVPERLNGRDWKSRDGGNLVRGFESLPLRIQASMPSRAGAAHGSLDWGARSRSAGKRGVDPRHDAREVGDIAVVEGACECSAQQLVVARPSAPGQRATPRGDRCKRGARVVGIGIALHEPGGVHPVEQLREPRR